MKDVIFSHSRVFGHFEKGVFLHLCRHMETVKLREGDLLFDIGQMDKWMYVIQEGHVNLYIRKDETEVCCCCCPLNMFSF